MSALLFFNYAYTANAAQTTTLTVSGEQQDSRPEGVAVPDEIVVVDVTAAELNNLMDVGTQGTTGVGYPQVVLDWASVTSLNGKWTSFMEGQLTGVAPIDFQDDSEEGNKPTLQKVFSTASFEFTTNAGNVLLSIPPEAIKNVDYSGAIALTYGQTTLSPTAAPTISAVRLNQLKALSVIYASTEMSSSYSSARQNWFTVNDPCSFTGVTCDANYYITAIDLSN
jgi:hypothetical protein